jgi:hypothetical protein
MLWKIADQFRAWVVRDLAALGEDERAQFRGDFLFYVDSQPSFLVVVTPKTVSSGRLSVGDGGAEVAFDMGAPLQMDEASVHDLLREGAVRVRVSTDSNTLRRLLAGTLKAKIAYLNGLVKISGDLPCFMRLVAVLKGRGVGPLQATEPGASELPSPRPLR